MCFRQRQTETKETKSIWKDSAIIMKGKKGPRRTTETIARTGERRTISDVLLGKTISHKETNPGGDKGADFGNTKHTAQTNSVRMILSYRHAPPPGHLTASLPGHCRSDSSLHNARTLDSAPVPSGLRTAYAAWRQHTFEPKPVCRYSASFRREISTENATQTPPGLCSAAAQSLNLWGEQKYSHRRLIATNPQEWSTVYSEIRFHLPEFPSLPHFHQLHHHPKMKSKQYN